MATQAGGLLMAAEKGQANISLESRRVWTSFPGGLSLEYQRLLGVMRGAQELRRSLSEAALSALCRCAGGTVDPQACIIAPYPGYLLCQDTHFVGDLKGLGEMTGPGKVFLQVVVDAYCSMAFARLYVSNTAQTAISMLQDCVLPFYALQGLKVERVLTDNGKEYTSRLRAHPFETFLSRPGIEHVRMDSFPAASGNLFCSQFSLILEEEFFAPTLRKVFYLSLEPLQHDLDAFLKQYNCERSCPGIRTQGRTPYRAFLDGAEEQMAQACDAVNQKP